MFSMLRILPKINVNGKVETSKIKKSKRELSFDITISFSLFGKLKKKHKKTKKENEEETK